MKYYLDYSEELEKYRTNCEYRVQLENKLKSNITSLLNELFASRISIKDLHSRIKDADKIIDSIFYVRSVMDKIESDMLDSISSSNEKIGVMDKSSYISKITETYEKINISDIYQTRDLIYRVIMAINNMDIIPSRESERESFDNDLYKTFTKKLRIVDEYYRLSMASEDSIAFAAGHDYEHVFTRSDIDLLENPVSIVSSVSEEDGMDNSDDFVDGEPDDELDDSDDFVDEDDELDDSDDFVDEDDDLDDSDDFVDGEPDDDLDDSDEFVDADEEDGYTMDTVRKTVDKCELIINYLMSHDYISDDDSLFVGLDELNGLVNDITAPVEEANEKLNLLIFSICMKLKEILEIEVEKDLKYKPKDKEFVSISVKLYNNIVSDLDKDNETDIVISNNIVQTTKTCEFEIIKKSLLYDIQQVKNIFRLDYPTSDLPDAIEDREIRINDIIVADDVKKAAGDLALEVNGCFNLVNSATVDNVFKELIGNEEDYKLEQVNELKNHLLLIVNREMKRFFDVSRDVDYRSTYNDILNDVSLLEQIERFKEICKPKNEQNPLDSKPADDFAFDDIDDATDDYVVEKEKLNKYKPIINYLESRGLIDDNSLTVLLDTSIEKLETKGVDEFASIEEKIEENISLVLRDCINRKVSNKTNYLDYRETDIEKVRELLNNMISSIDNYENDEGFYDAFDSEINIFVDKSINTLNIQLEYKIISEVYELINNNETLKGINVNFDYELNELSNFVSENETNKTLGILKGKIKIILEKCRDKTNKVLVELLKSTNTVDDENVLGKIVDEYLVNYFSLLNTYSLSDIVEQLKNDERVKKTVVDEEIDDPDDVKDFSGEDIDDDEVFDEPTFGTDESTDDEQTAQPVVLDDEDSVEDSDDELEVQIENTEEEENVKKDPGIGTVQTSTDEATSPLQEGEKPFSNSGKNVSGEEGYIYYMLSQNSNIDSEEMFYETVKTGLGKSVEFEAKIFSISEEAGDYYLNIVNKKNNKNSKIRLDYNRYKNWLKKGKDVSSVALVKTDWEEIRIKRVQKVNVEDSVIASAQTIEGLSPEVMMQIIKGFLLRAISKLEIKDGKIEIPLDGSITDMKDIVIYLGGEAVNIPINSSVKEKESTSKKM